MAESSTRARSEDGVLGGIAAIVAIGLALGLAYNYLGLRSKPSFGLAWLAHDRTEDVAVLPADAADGDAARGGFTSIDDPMAVITGGAASTAAALPEIPALDRPIQLQLSVAKRFFDAGGALFVDAREPDEYAEGHIPGAIDLPFDTAATDPARIAALDTRGRPIIVYCGGGTCEVSINLAWVLLENGHDRVTYFQAGYPGWVEAGYPIATGSTAEGS